MPDDKGNMTEQEKADLAKRRGQAAAQIADPEAKRKFIAEQGETEAKNKGNIPAADAKRMSEDAALKGYKKGTDRVPATGVYKLHKDEAVLAKPHAEKYRAAMSELAGDDEGEDKKPAKKLKEMRIRKAGKGHIVEHHHTEPMHHPMEEHVMSSMDDLHNHMEEHMGTPNPGEQDADDGKSGMEEAEPSVVAAQEAGGQ